MIVAAHNPFGKIIAMHEAQADTNPQAESACPCIAQSLSSTLDELAAVLGTLSSTDYTRPMGPHFSGGTIGGHVRHTLDHLRALAGGQASGVVDYDHRDRGTPVETNLQAAMRELANLTAALDGLASQDPAEPLAVVIMPSRDGPPTTLLSTLARELAFVLSHTIHHNATVRGMVASLGIEPPPSFGYAPSTLAHQDSSRCAR